MQAILNEINSVHGVIGAFVALADGGVGAQTMPDGFESDRLELAARIACQTFNALEISGQRVVEMDLQFAKNRLIIKNLRGSVLAILCARNTSLPFLNLTANSVAKRISAELKPREHPLVDSAHPKIAPSPQRHTTAVADSPSPPSATTENNSTLPESVEKKFFDQLTWELTRVMGPPASLIIEDEVGLMKEARGRFPKVRAAELVERLGATIHDANKQSRFRQIMLEVVQNL